MHLSGYYQQPGRAAREAARLSLYSHHVELQQGDAARQFSLQEITLSEALGSIPLTLSFADGGRFVPADDALLRQWAAQHKRVSWIHRLERNRRGVLAVLLATLVLVVLYVWVLLPWASRHLALHMPDYVAQQLGQQTQRWLAVSGFSASELPAAQTQRIQRLFAQVVPAELQTDSLPPQLRLMQFPGGPNALMLADGTLIISDSLAKLATHDDGLAAIMLHEMGHHRWRHPMRMLVRSSLVTLSYMWMTGDVSGIGDTLLQSAAFVDQMHFSRDMEREADQWAIEKMQAQGRSLEEMARIYALIAAESGKQDRGLELPQWLSTHPDMPHRIEAIRAAGKKL